MNIRFFTHSEWEKSDDDEETEQCPGSQEDDAVDAGEDEDDGNAQGQRSKGDALPQPLPVITHQVHKLRKIGEGVGERDGRMIGGVGGQWGIREE